jgi:hypothetical protein
MLFFRLLDYHRIRESLLRGPLLFSHFAPRTTVFSRRKVGVAQACLHQFRGLICIYNTLLPLMILCATVSHRLCWEPRSIFCALFKDFFASLGFFDFSTILDSQRFNIPALCILLNASVKKPILATLVMHLLTHSSWFWYATSIRSCVSR